MVWICKKTDYFNDIYNTYKIFYKKKEIKTKN